MNHSENAVALERATLMLRSSLLSPNYKADSFIGEEGAFTHTKKEFQESKGFLNNSACPHAYRTHSKIIINLLLMNKYNFYFRTTPSHCAGQFVCFRYISIRNASSSLGGKKSPH